MINRILLLGLIAVAGPVYALRPVAPAGLQSTEMVRPLLERDPAVAAARAGLDVGQHEASSIERSPYEWTPRVTSQKRRQDNGASYNEWNVGVERTLRLPGKASADRDIAAATMEIARARYGEALHEAAREYMTLWVDWMVAERALELAERNLTSGEESLAAVEKRLKAGDASKLDLSVARAEQSEQRRLHNDAKTQAIAAWLRLSTRFPSVTKQTVQFPAPEQVTQGLPIWRERILAESDELKVVQGMHRRTLAYAERARADRLPDPTLGVFRASESGGIERVTGVTISIPLPGGARFSRSARAVAEVQVSVQEVELKKREVEAVIATLFTTARGSYDSFQIAQEGAAAMQENSTLTQRAYALGEADLQTMLLSRRQAIVAANNALQAQATALKTYYGLLIDAHLVWDLERD